jgi:phosphatidylglycerophosphate synthase
MKNKSKIEREFYKLDLVWRAIALLLLILFVYGLIRFNKDPSSINFILTIIIAMTIYDLISIIDYFIYRYNKRKCRKV